MRPLFPAEALPNGELLQQAVQGHYYILSPQEYPAVQSLVRSMLAEMQQRQMDYAISVRGCSWRWRELMRITARRESAGWPRPIPVAGAWNTSTGTIWRISPSRHWPGCAA